MMNRDLYWNRIWSQIRELAQMHKIGKVVLFGSRARGTNFLKSDIDLAVYGCNTEQFVKFSYDIDEKVDTLLKFDIVDMSEADETLIQEVSRDGKVIFEANA